MRAKAITLLIIMAVLQQAATAQIHIKGTRFLDLAAGFVDGTNFSPGEDQSGFWAGVTTGKYDRNENALRFSLEFRQKYYAYSLDTLGKAKTLPVRHYGLTTGYQFKLFKSTDRVLYVNLVPAAGVLYESINNNVSIIDELKVNNKSRFLLTVNPAVEIEIGAFVIQCRQIWHPKSTIKPFTTELGFSYRINR